MDAAFLLLCTALASAALALALALALGRSRRRRDTRSLMVVLGSGGHTSEMLALLEAVDGARYDPVHWAHADTDTTSLPRLRVSELRLLATAKRHEYHAIPRSREVRQSWFTSVFTTARAAWYAAALVFRVQPDVLVVNGPGTCVPVCAGALLLGAASLGWRRPRIVFVESFCRVRTLSLSGKLLYRVADEFIVQWPGLARAHPRARYLGVLY